MKTKNTFKRIFVALMSTALLMSASCSFGGGDDDKPEPKTLTEKISAADGTLDLKGQAIAEDAFISKKDFTLKNADLGGKILMVTKPGAVLENISNAKIIVDESVGDGDFTMKGCKDIINLTVNGGGSNSVHILDSKIQSLVVTKTSVRIVLEGAASVASAEVKADSIKLEGNANSTVAKISMSNAVSAISIKGGSIQKIITLNAVSIKVESSETVIDSVMSSSTVKIEKAEGVVIKEPEVLENATIGDDYEEVKETEKPEEETEPEEPKKEEEEEEAPIPEIFKIVSLPCSTGIRIQVKNLDGSDIVLREKTREVNRIDIYIDNVATVCELPKTDSTYEFYYPFVDAGTEIEVEARYFRELRDEKNLKVWAGSPGRGKLNITPTSGSGKINYEGEIEYDFSERGILNVTSAPSFAAQDGIKSYSFYFDVASGNSWDDGGWLGHIIINSNEIPGEKDYYDVDYNTVYGADPAFIDPYVSIKYEDPENGHEWTIRHNYEIKKGLKLMSLAKRHETDIPETIELIPLEWDGGLKLKFTNVELSPGWSNKDDVIWIYVDGVNIEMGTPDEEFYFPFVNPGEEVTVQIIHEVDIKDDNGNRTMKYSKAASPKVKITPAGGLGKINVSGELEYTADEYGILNITGIPSVEPAGLEWAIQFDIAEGTDWDDGNWRGCVTVPRERLPGKANYYLDGWTEFKDSIDHGFIGPQLIYYWTDPEGYRHEYRADLGSYRWFKFDYKLKSYDQMLSDGVVELPINISVTDTDDGLLIAAMDRSGENPYRFLTTSSNDQLRLHIDDKLVSIIDGNWGGDLKYFTNYPFVTPGKEIKIKLDHYQEDWNRQGEIIKARIIESGEINYTPRTGRGEIRYEGDFEYTVDTDGYGMVKVTKAPEILPEPKEGESWNIFFNFSKGTKEDNMWFGEIQMRQSEVQNGTLRNLYDRNGTVVNNEGGFDRGFVEPYIVYHIDGCEFRNYCFTDACLENVILKSKIQVVNALQGTYDFDHDD